MIIVKSVRSNYRKHVIIEISKTDINNSIKWVKCPYVVTYCLEKFLDITSIAFYGQPWRFTDRQ